MRSIGIAEKDVEFEVADTPDGGIEVIPHFTERAWRRFTKAAKKHHMSEQELFDYLLRTALGFQESA